MRYLVLLALSLSAALAEYNSRGYLLSKYNKLPQASLNLYQRRVDRVRRDIRVHRLEDPGSCIKNCSRTMHEGLQSLNDTDSEEVAAKELCKALGPAETCYKSCPKSQFQQLMLDFQPTMRVPCLLGDDKYPELKKTLDCLNSTDDAISSKCDPMCNSTLSDDIRVESRILVNVNPPFIMYDDDKAANTKMLSATCRYLACQQKCGDPIVKEKCGQMAIDVDHKITASVFGSVIKLYKDMKALESDLAECKSLQ